MPSYVNAVLISEREFKLQTFFFFEEKENIFSKWNSSSFLLSREKFISTRKEKEEKVQHIFPWRGNSKATTFMIFFTAHRS